MKTNRVPIIFLTLLVLVTLSGCSLAKKGTQKVTSKLSSTLQDYARKEYKKAAEGMIGDIELPDDVVIEEKDDFMPMIPDGYQKMTITLPEGYDFSSYIDDSWTSYPMSDDAKKVVDGYLEADKGQSSLTDQYIPSDIENGSYRFIAWEKDTGWVASKTDENIRKTFLENTPQTYAVAAYDSDEKKLYLYYLSW